MKSKKAELVERKFSKELGVSGWKTTVVPFGYEGTPEYSEALHEALGKALYAGCMIDVKTDSRYDGYNGIIFIDMNRDKTLVNIRTKVISKRRTPGKEFGGVEESNQLYDVQGIGNDQSTRYNPDFKEGKYRGKFTPKKLADSAIQYEFENDKFVQSAKKINFDADELKGDDPDNYEIVESMGYIYNRSAKSFSNTKHTLRRFSGASDAEGKWKNINDLIEDVE